MDWNVRESISPDIKIRFVVNNWAEQTLVQLEKLRAMIDCYGYLYTNIVKEIVP